jgi:hypothetical protein
LLKSVKCAIHLKAKAKELSGAGFVRGKVLGKTIDEIRIKWYNQFVVLLQKIWSATTLASNVLQRRL